VPDLIIIDYLDLMKPHREYHSEHAEIDAITKGIIGFAAEFDTAVYTATQMNRSGMVSDTPDEAGMAGYVGKQYHADMVMWMAQTREEREEEIMRLWVSKNRNGKTGTIHLETNYSYMKFYERAVAKTDENKAKATTIVKQSTKATKATKAAVDSAAAAEIKDDLATALLNAVGKDDD
jgi:replicative DNA helicase